MDCYFAPMEGVTGYVYRNAHHQLYGGITRYYTPFIAPGQSRKLTSREMNDILPEHNRGIPLVPQVLTNRAGDFLWAAEKIQSLGYEEVNLNLGCPSGTVVSKNRGSGFLAMPEELNSFLEQVSRELQQRGMKFSIKTRIGKRDPGEFQGLLKIFNQYPLESLIIHPRTQADFYQNHPNREVFRQAVEGSKNPLCYNGDIFSTEDAAALRESFPMLQAMMLGRGLLRDPALAEKITGNARKGVAAEPAEGSIKEDSERQRLKHFHDILLSGYQEAIPGERNVLFKMKELWAYLGSSFDNSGRPLKKIKKAKRIEEYMAAVEQLFADGKLIL
ncbi:MAG: tRNA-dihydrouridine synthase family protein [Lachnospiraceae bacterium]|nr:tRNA-dihydrouridine synthase family protein [Lachnospiraceae bacterium]